MLKENNKIKWTILGNHIFDKRYSEIYHMNFLELYKSFSII